MTNHPNRTRYDLFVQSFQNSGRGWERIPSDKAGVDRHFRVTLDEAEKIVARRDLTCTQAALHKSADPEFAVATAGFGEAKLQWI